MKYNLCDLYKENIQLNKDEIFNCDMCIKIK